MKAELLNITDVPVPLAEGPTDLANQQDSKGGKADNSGDPSDAHRTKK